MVTPNQLLKRLERIGQSLKDTNKALALLGLGSVGQQTERLDQYSDLDFFVIVEPGQKQHFLASLYWLEAIGPLVYQVRNTVDGYKALYEDGIFCEFAIFEPHELAHIPFSSGRVVWQQPAFDASICIPATTQQPNTVDQEWQLGEALTNLYVGMCRFQRGEKLSAMRFVQSFALDRIIELVACIEPSQPSQVDPFVSDRRLEERYPEFAQLLPRFAQGYQNTPQSTIAQLDFLEQHFDINTAIAARIRTLCEQR
jgi:hypothetical protein